MRHDDLTYRLAMVLQDERLRQAEQARLLTQLDVATASRPSVRCRTGSGLMRLGYWVGGDALRRILDQELVASPFDSVNSTATMA